MSRRNRRTVLSLCVACALIAGTPGAALAWAAGTHAYIAMHTDKRADQVDPAELCNRVYGANATDLFNTRFTEDGQRLARALHDRGRLVPLLPWNHAVSDRARAFAYGMASHNDTWGTDAFAHYSGKTFGRQEGYVVAKALALREELRSLLAGKLEVADEPLLTIAHVLVEYGADVLVARTDPAVSPALMAATACWAPDGEPPAQLMLLLEALVPELANDVGAARAASEIAEAVPPFLAELGATGWVLGLEPQEAVWAIAAATAGRAEQFLGLPPGALDGLRPQLTEVAAYGISRGMELCAPDLLPELEATIGRVNGTMSALGITP